MTRPETKTALLERTESQRQALCALVDSMSSEQVLAPGSLGTWSVKDTVAHLVAWERLFRDWYEAGVRGDPPALPAPGYSWNTMDALNDEMLRTWRDVPWRQIRDAWDESSAALAAIVAAVPDDALMHSGTWAWTGRGTLAGYAWACGGEHYEWARTEIERGRRSSAPA